MKKGLMGMVGAIPFLLITADAAAALVEVKANGVITSISALRVGLPSHIAVGDVWEGTWIYDTAKTIDEFSQTQIFGARAGVGYGVSQPFITESEVLIEGASYTITDSDNEVITSIEPSDRFFDIFTQRYKQLVSTTINDDYQYIFKTIRRSKAV
jgi:hypothetical protein